MQYFYIIQHLASKRYYAGSKFSKRNSDPAQLLNPNHKCPYFTSSKLIKALIAEDGVDSFVIVKLKTFPEGGAFSYETRFLQKINARDNPNWINSHNNTGEFGKGSSPGIIFTKERRENISKSLRGKKLSEQHKKQVSETLSGRSLSDDHRKNIGLGGRGIKKPGTSAASTARMTGVPKSDSCKAAISKTLLGVKQETVHCPHCNKIGGVRAMKRFHFDNCKAITG